MHPPCFAKLTAISSATMPKLYHHYGPQGRRSWSQDGSNAAIRQPTWRLVAQIAPHVAQAVRRQVERSARQTRDAKWSSTVIYGHSPACRRQEEWRQYTPTSSKRSKCRRVSAMHPSTWAQYCGSCAASVECAMQDPTASTAGSQSPTRSRGLDQGGLDQIGFRKLW